MYWRTKSETRARAMAVGKDFIDAEIEFSKSNAQIIVSSIPEHLESLDNNAYLTFSKLKLNPINKLKQLYGLADKLGEYIGGFSPCSKGCSKCCHYNVSITEYEVQIIEKEMGVKRNKKAKVNKDFHGAPCPFLDNSGRCSIYSARPYSCRTHYALTRTAELCEPELSVQYEADMIRFNGLDRAFNAARKDLKVYDIRQLFGK
jgi:uncharacterized protein